MDTIYIEQLEVETLIGVYDWERTSSTSLLLDVALSVDLSAAAVSDQVSDTVDYGAVAQTLMKVATSSEFELLESLAERMIRTTFQDYPLVHHIDLKVSKPGIIPQAQNVAIRLQRERP